MSTSSLGARAGVALDGEGGAWVLWAWRSQTPPRVGVAVPGARAGGGAASGALAPPSPGSSRLGQAGGQGGRRTARAMKVKKGGGGAGPAVEPVPGSSGLSLEPRPAPPLQADSDSDSGSEPEAGPERRSGPPRRKPPIGPQDVLGLQRITGGEHPRGSTARGGRGPSRRALASARPFARPPPCLAAPTLHPLRPGPLPGTLFRVSGL